MRWTHVLAVGAAASIAVTAACSAPAANTPGSNDTVGPVDEAKGVTDPTAVGPAPAIAGVQTGGVLTVSYASQPSDFDPSAQYYQDSAAIMRLMHRSLTTFVERNGQMVLVPDLATDLGQVSADGLQWTFKLKDGLKYNDGTPVTSADIAYAIKRSFAFTDTGPTYQVDYLKGGADYKGPFEGGDFAGVETPDASTVVFNLEKKWETLPYFMSFTQASPVQEAKDTKDRSYGDNAPTTGPYQIKSYTAGSRLVLEKNANWDPASDPARYQNTDGYEFKFGEDTIKVQQGILASNGPDATTLNWDGIDSSLQADVSAKPDQFVSGPSVCTVAINMDTRKIPLEVRKAIAAAVPFEDLNKANGLTSLSATPANGLLMQQMPGHLDFSVENVTPGKNGDIAKAKELLAAAGEEGFELVYYFIEDDPSGIAQKSNTVFKKAMESVGFVVKDIGTAGDKFRELRAKIDGPHNMRQSPGGWCFDWPSGDSVFPPTVSSTQINGGGSNWGNLAIPEVDAELNRISALPIAEQGPEWGKFDQWLLENYLPAVPWYWDRANYLFGTSVMNVKNNTNLGMPILDAIWIKQ